jgi:hypothetical protein
MLGGGEIAQLKADHAQLRADIERKNAEIAELKADSAAVKAYICGKEPQAPLCAH